MVVLTTFISPRSHLLAASSPPHCCKQELIVIQFHTQPSSSRKSLLKINPISQKIDQRSLFMKLISKRIFRIQLLLCPYPQSTSLICVNISVLIKIFHITWCSGRSGILFKRRDAINIILVLALSCTTTIFLYPWIWQTSSSDSTPI